MSDDVPYEPFNNRTSNVGSQNLTSTAAAQPLAVGRSRKSSLMPDWQNATLIDSSLTLKDALPADALHVHNFLDSNLVTQSDQNHDITARFQSINSMTPN
jgi:hypothetical protein